MEEIKKPIVPPTEEDPRENPDKDIPADATVTTTNTGVKALLARTPAGEADEFRGIILLDANRPEEALPNLEKAAKEGRPASQLFAAILRADSTLEEFLEDVDQILAAFLELFPSIRDMQLHVGHVLKKLKNLSQYQEPDQQPQAPTQPPSKESIYTLARTYFHQKTPTDKIETIKKLIAELEAFTSMPPPQA